MLVGILSDTHGRVAPTKLALDILRGAGSEFYVHCGDVGDESIFDLMAGLPLAFVWGNTDYDRADLRSYAEKLGIICHEDLADLKLDGRRIAVTHGDNANLLKTLTIARRHDCILHGHTHIARDQMIDGIRWINPGAVHRSPQPSVAVLDTQAQTVRFIHLRREGT